MTKILFAGLALALSSPVYAEALPLSVQTQIKDKIAVSLLDPMSAQYRWPARSPKSVSYCGFVNAKNKFGGYTGFQPFLVILTVDAKNKYTVGRPTVVEGPRDLLFDYVRSSCAALGVDVTKPPVR